MKHLFYIPLIVVLCFLLMLDDIMYGIEEPDADI